jgi:cyclase
MRKLIIAVIVLSCIAAAQQPQSQAQQPQQPQQPRPAQPQPDWNAVQIKVHKVAGNVYMLEGRGGNIGVSVGEDGLVMVDSQYLPLADKIEAALGKLGSDKPKFILNTHWHGDHTGGNPHFGTKAPILAHENVRKRVAAGGKTRFGDIPPVTGPGLPVITFTEQLTVHLNGEDIRAIHFPNGHTDGDSVIFFTQSNVVHMGDDFFAGRFPFIDLDSGGSVQGLIAGVDKVLGEIPNDVTIIPGHGPISKKADLQNFVAMLKDTSGMVQAAIKKGQTLEQIKAAKLFDAKYKEWGSGFINADVWAEIVYNSYAKSKTGHNPHHPHGHDTGH